MNCVRVEKVTNNVTNGIIVRNTLVMVSYSSLHAKSLYAAFYRHAKHTIRLVMSRSPGISFHMKMIMVVMKVLKKVNVRLPFKYYSILVDEPFGSEIRKFNTDFFINDPRFNIVGYQALTDTIRSEMKAMTPENYQLLMENMKILSKLCDDIITYKSLKHNTTCSAASCVSDDSEDIDYENRVEDELRKVSLMPCSVGDS